MASKSAKQIDKIIQTNLDKLRKRGVLTVRPGFEIANHQLTGKSAIVATVHTKQKNLPKADMLPNSISGIPVDVREASPFQRLCARNWPAAAVSQLIGRAENREPTWPFERQIPSGKLLRNLWSMSPKALMKSTASQPGMQKAVAAHAKKKQLKYVPAKNAPLTSVATTTTITAIVSPDAGFVTLQNFLAATKKSLVIGMYDFTSGSLLKEFERHEDRDWHVIIEDPESTWRLGSFWVDRATRSKILDAGLGIADLRKFPGGSHTFGRSAPSAGGLYPLECYVVCQRVMSTPPGIYHFNVPGRELETVGSCTLSEMLPDLMHQSFLKPASALLLLAAVLAVRPEVWLAWIPVCAH